jgi:hypothetical protein
MHRRCVGALVFLALAGLIGCGSKPPVIVPVEGVVLLNGTPLPNAKVRFFPTLEKSSDYLAQGVTDDNGHFTLTCHGQPGACAVENVVTVAEDDIPEHLTPESARAELQVYLKGLKNRPIPPQYRDASGTPIRVTVSADQREYKLDLKR